MTVKFQRHNPTMLTWKICFLTFLFVLAGSDPGFADARANAQAQCLEKLGAGAVAVEDFSFGETSYVCDCANPYAWNESGTACERSQSSETEQPAQSPQYESEEPPVSTGEDTQPPEAPVVRKKSRKKVQRKPTRKARKNTPRVKKKKRVVRRSAATARGYCRRRYGKRLVKVVVKKSKFYCHYKGKKAKGFNPRIKWKKIKFKNIR